MKYSADERAVLGAVLTVTYIKVLGEIWKIAVCPCDAHTQIRNSRH